MCAGWGPQGNRGEDENLEQDYRGPAADLGDWVEVLKKVHERKIQILAFANNHYAGYGPGTLEEFRRLWAENLEKAPSGRRTCFRSAGVSLAPRHEGPAVSRRVFEQKIAGGTPALTNLMHYCGFLYNP